MDWFEEAGRLIAATEIVIMNEAESEYDKLQKSYSGLRSK
jgi:hypothetical protein